MLAEFKYGLEPKETFGTFWDQSKPNRYVLCIFSFSIFNGRLRRFFYHLKKDIFPRAYWNLMVRDRAYF